MVVWDLVGIEPAGLDELLAFCRRLDDPLGHPPAEIGEPDDSAGMPVTCHGVLV